MSPATPVGVAVIGAGKFATMFLNRARRLGWLRIAAIADLRPERAREAMARAGLDPAGVAVVTDAVEAIGHPGVEVVIEATGDPVVGCRHALAAIAAGRHIVMVNVEADVLAGPLLARRAREAGVVYSLAWGDQPALICDLVDWARTSGFDVVCAGKGTKYMPHFHASTPETVWGHYGMDPEDARKGGLNPKMFNSFLDGTKSSIEMAAVANATGLLPPEAGLAFPPAGTSRLADVLKPHNEGGILQASGTVEVVSSVERDGSPIPDDLRWGVYVVFEGEDEYSRRCFAEYGFATDRSGRFAAMWKPFHLIGLELSISVARIAREGQGTGAPTGFRADVVATAKRDLAAGETLDGEGGSTVWGKLAMAPRSVAQGWLPLGLASNVVLKHPVASGQPLRWDDVEIDGTSEIVRLRREAESLVAAN